MVLLTELSPPARTVKHSGRGGQSAPPNRDGIAPGKVHRVVKTSEAAGSPHASAQYILRNPFPVEKMTLESPTDTVIYHSRLNAKINRNFEVFNPTDFLAAITQQIPTRPC
jgi:hypothetical protein